jgi:hypothetical protein
LSGTEGVFTRQMVCLSCILCSGVVTSVCVQAGVNNLLIKETTYGAESLGLHAFINMTIGVLFMNV